VCSRVTSCAGVNDSNASAAGRQWHRDLCRRWCHQRSRGRNQAQVYVSLTKTIRYSRLKIDSSDTLTHANPLWLSRFQVSGLSGAGWTHYSSYSLLCYECTSRSTMYQCTMYNVPETSKNNREERNKGSMSVGNTVWFSKQWFNFFVVDLVLTWEVLKGVYFVKWDGEERLDTISQ